MRLALAVVSGSGWGGTMGILGVLVFLVSIVALPMLTVRSVEMLGFFKRLAFAGSKKSNGSNGCYD